jgi:16S rRNA (uracil1498-N3)-methyltransferase
MSLPLFLVSSLPAGDRVRLDGPEGRHAADVARLRAGERLLLSDGAGTLATCDVVAAGRGFLDLLVLDRRVEPAPAPRLVVAQGLPKGDRAELAVQAMTEAGVDEIVPWQASRSIVRWQGDRATRALDRWRATARGAAKQSRRTHLPTVTEAAGTPGLVARLADGTGAVAGFVLHEEATVPLATVDLPAGLAEIVLVVGPEGGIAPDELDAFTAAGAVPVRLGPTVLRTSTAGVVALAVLNARTGRWS